MARKSVFYGGKNEGLSVQDMININREVKLAYDYYHYDKISFLPDILKELGIIGDLAISKPGKSTDLFPKWRKCFFQKMSDIERMKRHSVSKKNKKQKLKYYEGRVSKSKGFHKQKNINKLLTFSGKIK